MEEGRQGEGEKKGKESKRGGGWECRERMGVSREDGRGRPDYQYEYFVFSSGFGRSKVNGCGLHLLYSLCVF